jgi:beta-lactamase superfamily II metal-dependent hydrolase
MTKAFEIDFLGVGQDSRSGDAIALRFGNYENGHWNNQSIIIIDGGNRNSGQQLVDHVRSVYKSTYVDRVILTHPDADHASGLRTVLETLKVGKVWMHRPWNHWSDLKHSIQDGRITKASFSERLKEAYQFAYEVEKLAQKKNIEIFAPHQGCSFTIDETPILTCLGPGKDFYLSLIQSSDKTPNMTNEAIVKAFNESKKKYAYEDMSFETEHLSDVHEQTSSENDMSLILLFSYADQKILFTGDAGTMGLFKAIRYAIESKIDLKKLNLLQVPHHGSRHNISKGVLDYIYAPKAVVSCAKNGAPKHPSAIVTNALQRRGMKTYTTKGELINYHSGAPMRGDLVAIQPCAFENYVQVDAD